MYTGNYELKIDDKNRISVPYQLRELMHPERHGKAYYVGPGRLPGTLWLCADVHYRSQRVEMPHSDTLSAAAYRWQQWEASQTQWVAPDSQGRVTIPDRLMKYSGLPREVMMIGLFDHIEIWSRELFEAFEAQAWQDAAERRDAAMKEMVERGLYKTPPATTVVARPAATAPAA